jgi:Tfp pilus assembly protein PilE
MKISSPLLIPKEPDNRGINMVDLMMWLVIAALLLAAAIQSIGYYQQSAKVYLMKDEMNSVAASIYASAATAGETIHEDIINTVVGAHNAAHGTDDTVISYGSMLANASGATGDSYGFERTSAATASSSASSFYVKATSESVPDRYVVFFFDDTRTFPQGISTVSKSSIDNGGSIEEVTPGVTVPPTPSASAPVTVEPTSEPTVEPTLEPTPEPTVEVPSPPATTAPEDSTPTPTPVFDPSIPNKFDIVAFDSGGELWNFGPVAFDLANRESIGAAGALIPDDFYVTDWNNDGVQDLIVQKSNGDLMLRAGLAAGGFTDMRIGTGWKDWEITVGKWKKTDTYPSVIAKHKPSGDLYYYPNESGTVLDSLIRTKIATGWSSGLSQLNLADWDKDGNIDLMARNAANELLLYRTDGNGSFISTTGTLIGSGWNFQSINVISDRAGAGTVGLLARAASGDINYYPIYTSRFGPRILVSGGWSSYVMAGN